MSLAIGLGVTFAVTTSKHVVTCLPAARGDKTERYERVSRGYPLAFTSAPLKVPACPKYSGPRCATTYCDNYKGLDEAPGVSPIPLIMDMAIWSLAAGGLLYIIGAFFIRS